jgi:hypothetical protein
MKKIFFISLAAFAAVCMLNSCKEDGPINGGGGGKKTGDSYDIKIDGKFDDWKSSDIPTAELGEIENDYPNLLVLKSCGDKDNIYFYLEVKLDEEQTWSTFGLYIDADNDPLSGGVSWLWSKEGAGFEYSIESEDGFLKNNTTYAVMNDIKCYKNLGPDGVEVWGEGWLGWDENVASGFDSNAGVVKDGVAYVEIAVERSIINAKKAGATVNVGAVTFKQRTWVENINTETGQDEGWWDWPNGGALPASEDGVGQAELLAVKLP